jgi:hypothetical protein
VVEHAIREPGTETPGEYHSRVTRLALSYTGLFVSSLVGIVLLVWHGQFFVGLAQRSNVETLTLLFLLTLFGYVIVLSAKGVLGAARIGYYRLLVRLGRDPRGVERRKQEALGPPGGEGPTVALNRALEADGAPGRPFDMPIADDGGSLGTLHVDGVAITHREARKDGSSELLAYFVRQVQQVLEARGVHDELDVVEWKKLDDESTHKYLALVAFARNLERRLDAPGLWPTLALTAEDRAELERRLAAVCPSVREEGFLPHWEYAAEHKLPIIPEPLGLLSLSRTEKRVDAVASMGCAVLVVLALTAILALFVLIPPWVPGT